MAPSTRNAACRGATNTGTQGPTVPTSSVMRIRSGIAINPPAKQHDKRKRSAILQPSPVPDDRDWPKPRPLPRRSSSMTFEDYAQSPDNIEGNSNSNNDAPDDNGNEDHEYKDEDDDDSVHAKTSPEGDSDNDNDAKDANEEPEDGENNEDLETSPARRLWPQRVKKAIYNFNDGPQTSSLDSSYTSSQAKCEGPATSNQVCTQESDADENLDHDSPSSPPTKRRKTSSAVKITLANTSQKTTRSTTIRTKHARASISHSNDNPAPASIVFGPTPDIDAKGINEAQELGWKTAEEARVIGAKYGKSAHTILIEAGLSIKHSRVESDWNAHQCWFMDNHPRKDKASIVDWKEHQCKHYHVMGKENEQWNTICNYNVTGGNTNQSRTKTILLMREDIARKAHLLHLHILRVEAIGCIFVTTQHKAARQASGFVAGSDFIVKLINEHQLDACTILDWVVTATKAKATIYPQTKLPAIVIGGYGQLWYLSTLYKFMINNWPDDVPPIGPDFNPHNLSSQHLKLLVVPFIKHKAHSYYEAEFWTEAESLLEIGKKKSKGKHRGQKRTVEDVMSELDVNVPEIEFAAWPDDM
ncbi:hypothetical protein DFJ58DRAFT_725085 [Suillus subalutaceus]|uniref:uncharacterized protein n=1 Tax=Suillus subalutaceus TaxID=48586 RepID=UPI001B85C390|nr:uncharacterized protein DFJ58DRAFT_725085 [Suillus subalutaceus]KAG1863186.1 hypothetical protein DFJ58DRAFT_725085 [Suillus subalutaceus]